MLKIDNKYVIVLKCNENINYAMQITYMRERICSMSNFRLDFSKIASLKYS